MNAAFSGSTLPAKVACKLCFVEEQKAVLRPQYRRYRRSWWQSFMSVAQTHLIRSERRV